MTYESHITYIPKNVQAEDRIAAIAEEKGWKLSRIDGDPVLGGGVKCYLTKHSEDFELLRIEMRSMSVEVQFLGHRDVQVLREKIEHVIIDRVY